MSYYTSYTLTINQLSLEEGELIQGSDKLHFQLGEELSLDLEMVIVSELRKTFYYAKHALNSDGSPNDATSWYDHDEDMILFSKKYNFLTFVLYGRGEQNEDVWISIYKNGVHTKSKAVIMFSNLLEVLESYQ